MKITLLCRIRHDQAEITDNSKAISQLSPHEIFQFVGRVLRHVDSFTMRQVKWIGELRSQSDCGASRLNRNLMLPRESKKHFCALIKTNDAADICWRKWVGNEIALFFGKFIFYRFPLHAAIVESFTAKSRAKEINETLALPSRDVLNRVKAATA